MKLSEILKGVEVVSLQGNRDPEIDQIAYDSRKVSKGDVFVAMRGEKSDGHLFIKDAVEKGALAIVCEEKGQEKGCDMSHASIARIMVKDSRAALAVMANNFYSCPSRDISVIGVTGTNGKTTTSYLLKTVLEAAGKKVGLIGTIQYMVGSEVYPAPHTTPESLEFQRLIRKMKDSGCTHVVTEVSSHALSQKRVDGTSFDTAIFTNLTRDHLDYHVDMEGYFSAKRRLFHEILESGRHAVINADDEYGRRLSQEIRNVITFGLATGADLVASGIENSFTGLKFIISERGAEFRMTSPLMGIPNVYNILAASGAARSLGLRWETIIKGMANAATVKGRFERVAAGQKFLAIIDYAHTEDALERLIYTARGLTEGRIITVFGCGGERDRGKRPNMGAVATRLSDFVIITSDNPRGEDPVRIIDEIVSGAVRRNYLVEPDREEAIRRAVLMASENDVLLVAGKGHETYQETGGRRVEFSDRDVLEKAIRQLINNA